MLAVPTAAGGSLAAHRSAIERRILGLRLPFNPGEQAAQALACSMRDAARC